jgi:hypothetical protein
MGTRADFYVGRGTEAEWLGSIAWDGYPAGVPAPAMTAATEQEWRDAIYAILAEDESATVPDHGWPWPWEDSGTTDYAYAFDGGRVWASPFGHAWFAPDLAAENCGEPEDSPESAVFPNMSRFKNVAHGGKRSGLIVVTPRGAE